jgi:hypothetical protein
MTKVRMALMEGKLRAFVEAMLPERRAMREEKQGTVRLNSIWMQRGKGEEQECGF